MPDLTASANDIVAITDKMMKARLVACCLAILPLACSISFAAVYGGMYSKMMALDPTLTYDMCGIPPALPTGAGLDTALRETNAQIAILWRMA